MLIKPPLPAQHRLLPRAGLAKQSGVALFMVLMVTLVIVALSVSLAVGVFSEHKISRSTADHAIARQAAEAALRDAEQDIMCQQWNATSNQFEFHSSILSATNPTPSPRAYCTKMPETCTEIGDAGITNICNAGMVAIPMSTGSALPSTTTDYVRCNQQFGAVTKQPEFKITGLNASTPLRAPYYTIEVYPDTTAGAKGVKSVFRIRARGFGRNTSTNVDLESIYRPCSQ
jgi:Tfp pilus assembly protein PilX